MSSSCVPLSAITPSWMTRGDHALVDDQDQIGVHDGGETVDDRDDRALSGQLADRFLYLLFRAPTRYQAALCAG